MEQGIGRGYRGLGKNPTGVIFLKNGGMFGGSSCVKDIETSLNLKDNLWKNHTEFRCWLQLFLHKKGIDSQASKEKVDMVHAMLNDDSEIHGNANTWDDTDQAKINQECV